MKSAHFVRIFFTFQNCRLCQGCISWHCQKHEPFSYLVCQCKSRKVFPCRSDCGVLQEIVRLFWGNPQRITGYGSENQFISACSGQLIDITTKKFCKSWFDDRISLLISVSLESMLLIFGTQSDFSGGL